MDNVCVFADQNQLSCVAVAVANQAQVMKISKSLGLECDFRAACGNPKIIQTVFESFVAAAKTGKLHKQEIPSKIFLDIDQWTPDTGLVTDALKLKRKVALKFYLFSYFMIFFQII